MNAPEKIKPQSIRGLEEYSGDDWHKRQSMIQAIGHAMEARGFVALETPAIELGEMLSDFIAPDEIFNLGGIKTENFVLRYDLTAPLARYVAENFESLPKPFRRYQVGAVFRNDKPDDGRFKQFTQMDADTIGTDNPAADAEMVMMLCDCLQAAGLQRGDYVIRVNHRAILDKVFDSLATLPVARENLMRTLDKYDRLGEKAVSALLGEGRRDSSGDFTSGANLKPEQISELIAFLQLSKNKTRAQFIQEINSRYGENDGTADLAAMDAIFNALGFDESQIKFDSAIVRGLDYYTGIVFEAEVGSKIGSVGGGGRYDNLLSRFRAEKVPAVGMSVGISRLHYFLNTKDEAQETSNLIIILAMEQEQMAHYQKLAASLRASGLRAEVYVGSGNMKKQLKYADKRKARLALIQGEDERAQNQITIKDLQLGEAIARQVQDRDEWRQGARTQETIAESALVETCLNLLAPR